MNNNPTALDCSGKNSSDPENTIHERILNIYWEKKSLEAFLPKIATYSDAKQLAAITLSQLSIIDKQLVWLLQELSQQEN
jgi:hypothetical protein